MIIRHRYGALGSRPIGRSMADDEPLERRQRVRVDVLTKRLRRNCPDRNLECQGPRISQHPGTARSEAMSGRSWRSETRVRECPFHRICAEPPPSRATAS